MPRKAKENEELESVKKEIEENKVKCFAIQGDVSNFDDCEELVKIIKTLYLRKKLRLENGKKVTAVDMKYLRLAEEQLYGELAVVLAIERGKVENYIIEYIEKEKRTAEK